MSGQSQSRKFHASEPQPEQIRVRWLSLDQLTASTSAWQTLANIAIDPNPFYEPDYLLASLVHLEGKTKPLFLTLWDEKNRDQMVGFFPLQQRWLKHGFIRPVLSLYHSQFTVVTNPLIDPRDPAGIWQKALEAINDRHDLPDFLNLHASYANGPGANALRKVLSKNHLPFVEIGSFKRPLVEFTEDSTSYQMGWSRKRRKSINRAIRKGDRAGQITFETVTCTDPGFQQAFENFLNLECSGWKGQNGTALASTQRLKAFATAALAAQNQSPQVHIDQLFVNGQVIAANINMISH